MSQNCILLNSDKTDLLIIGPKLLRDKFMQFSSQLYGFVSANEVVKNLGLTIQNCLSWLILIISP